MSSALDIAEVLEPRGADPDEPSEEDQNYAVSGPDVGDRPQIATGPTLEGPAIKVTDGDLTPDSSLPGEDGPGPDAAGADELADGEEGDPNLPPAVQPTDTTDGETGEAIDPVVELKCEEPANSSVRGDSMPRPSPEGHADPDPAAEGNPELAVRREDVLSDTPVKVEVLTLEKVFGEIKKKHLACQKCVKLARLAVYHARDTGRQLNLAKNMVPKGQWEAEVKKHCGYSMETARGYMRVDRDWNRLGLPEDPDRQLVTGLGLRDALKALAKPKSLQEQGRTPQPPETPTGNSTETNGRGGDLSPDHPSPLPAEEPGPREEQSDVKSPPEPPGDPHRPIDADGRAPDDGDSPALEPDPAPARVKAVEHSRENNVEKVEAATLVPDSAINRHARAGQSALLNGLQVEAGDAVAAFLHSAFVEDRKQWAAKAADVGLSLEELAAREVIKSVLEILEPELAKAGA
jgi:hypothetical protein